MKNLGSKMIETERLILRKLDIEDYKSMYNNWATDPEVVKYVLWDLHKSIEETKEIIEKWVSEYEVEHTYRWGIVEKDSGELIGSIDVVKKSIKNEICELGSCMGSKWWNKGYNTEVLKAVLRFLIDEVGFHIIEIRVEEGNAGSRRVQEKAGMIYEGKLRSRVIDKNGKRQDLHIYSITKEELIN